jgi:hypothetical protein
MQTLGLSIFAVLPEARAKKVIQGDLRIPENSAEDRGHDKLFCKELMGVDNKLIIACVTSQDQFLNYFRLLVRNTAHWIRFN